MIAAGRIDVHQHMVPPGYVETLRQHGRSDSGGRGFPAWSPAAAADFMDRFGIDTGLLSVSAPGVWVDDSRASASLAWEVNDYGAELVKDRPDRFGLLSSLPLPDVAAARTEAARVHDDLHTDGYILMANNDGTYLGDPLYDPLMEVLDAQSAVVLVHPTALPGGSAPGIPAFAVDFLLDTTRAATNLVLHDVPQRFPHIRFVLSHAGGFLPYATHRVATLASAHHFQASLGVPARSTDELIGAMTGFWFDLALSGSRTALPSLLAFARPDRIVFGSDHPYPPTDVIAYFTTGYEQYAGIDDDQRRRIDRSNAEGLFARLSATPTRTTGSATPDIL